MQGLTQRAMIVRNILPEQQEALQQAALVNANPGAPPPPNATDQAQQLNTVVNPAVIIEVVPVSGPDIEHMKEVIIELKADLKERGIEAYGKTKPGEADRSPVDKANGSRIKKATCDNEKVLSHVFNVLANPSENDQRDLLPYLKTACKDIGNGSSSNTPIRVHMVNSALEQVDTGRKRKAEQNQGSADDDDLFGQLKIIRPNHVEMPVFTFLDDD